MEILIILFKWFIQMHMNPLKGIFSDKLLIIVCGNVKLQRNMTAEGFELFSCLSHRRIKVKEDCYAPEEGRH